MSTDSSPSILSSARFPTTSLPSPSRPRIHLASSKLVKKARESRFLGDTPIIIENTPPVKEKDRRIFDDGVGREGRAGEAGMKEEGWYKRYYPCGGLDVQPYASQLPYFLSYSNAALDWDIVRQLIIEGSVAHNENENVTPARPPPRRVLDVGCGSGYWMMNQAKVRGWEKTEFVGLDAAPSRFSDTQLPNYLAGRITHVQHDFSNPLPFVDNEFDFVRISFLNFSLPEMAWADVLEEIVRVLAPGCYLEIVEKDFAVYEDGNRKGLKSVQGIFETILDSRFINFRPLTVIPSNLALTARDLRSTGRISLELPSSPSPRSSQSASSTSVSPQLPPLAKYAAGTDPQLVIPSTSSASRVSLHAYAEAYISSSHGLATTALDVIDSRRRNSSHLNDDVYDEDLQRGRREKDLSDLEDLVQVWGDDLKHRAGIAQLVSSTFGWEPTFDRKYCQALEGNLPVLEERLMRFGQERKRKSSSGAGGGAFDGQVDPEIEFRFQQVELAKREAEAELNRVRRRLGERGNEEGGGGTDPILGTMDFEVFVAKAP